MSVYRGIKQVFKARPHLEGAGVRLKRVFGVSEVPLFDPFLMMDDFRSDNPAEYHAGFPWHPHRGIETVTYLINGTIKHEDSMGHKDIIMPGEAQWMTAGNGIIHQEMPDGDEKYRLWGFQLWVNLPAKKKMIAPRYRSIVSTEIPAIQFAPGVTVHILAGLLEKKKGPVKDLVAPCSYFDISLTANTAFECSIHKDWNYFVYISDGECYCNRKMKVLYGEGTCVLFEMIGDTIFFKAGPSGGRLILCGGVPINEPVAWTGPIVMNTQEELNKAFEEFENGTFLKTK